MVNKWRGKMDLEDVAMFDGPMLAEHLKIPFTYCWSPALVSKPKDWGPHIGKLSWRPDFATAQYHHQCLVLCC